MILTVLYIVLYLIDVIVRLGLGTLGQNYKWTGLRIIFQLNIQGNTGGALGKQAENREENCWVMLHLELVLVTWWVRASQSSSFISLFVGNNLSSEHCGLWWQGGDCAVRWSHHD